MKFYVGLAEFLRVMPAYEVLCGLGGISPRHARIGLHRTVDIIADFRRFVKGFSEISFLFILFFSEFGPDGCRFLFCILLICAKYLKSRLENVSLCQLTNPFVT